MGFTDKIFLDESHVADHREILISENKGESGLVPASMILQLILVSDIGWQLDAWALLPLDWECFQSSGSSPW